MERPILAAILSFEGTTLSDLEKRLLARYNPLGVTLFNRNLQNKQQMKRLISEIKEIVRGDQTIIAVDAEGGRVNRLAAAGFSSYAFQDTLARSSTPDKTVQSHARLIARDMFAAGANFNFAPVLDVAHPNMTAALEGRVFSSDPRQTAQLGQIMIKTYAASGICPCMKHLPGHGYAKTDPHLGLPVIDNPLSELEADFYPFEVCNFCPAGMTAHILIPEVDPFNPVTQSPKAIDCLIRGKIGFKGLLISDAIDMKALRGDITAKAWACWKAGCDAVCYCMGNISAMEALCREGKYLDDQGQTRLEKVLKVWQHNPRNVLDLEEKEYYSSIREVEQIHVAYDATETLQQMQKGEK